MTHDVMGSAYQFLFSEPAYGDEGLIDEGDTPLLVCPGDKEFIIVKLDLSIGYRAVVAHRILRRKKGTGSY
jgi:hypothetical protein